MSKLFRKRPVVVEAEQWFPGTDVEGVVETLEGNLIVSPGDWIVTGIKGEKYLVKADIFEATYKAVKDVPKTPQEHIEFRPHYATGDSRIIYYCMNKQGEHLGHVSWYPDWSQYTFSQGYEDAEFSTSCLEDIAHFLKRLNEGEST